MTKMELKDAAGISAASIAKLGKGANITTDVLLKICETLHCRIEDILETVDN
jgi:DNA-binding Xre family transcriptional regulator